MNAIFSFLLGALIVGAMWLWWTVMTSRSKSKTDTDLMDFVDSREATLLRSTERDEWAVLVGKKLVASGQELRDVLTRAKRMSR